MFLNILFAFIISFTILFPMTLIFYELCKFNWLTKTNPFESIVELYNFMKFNFDINIFSTYIIDNSCLIYLIILIISGFSSNYLYERMLFGIICINIIKYILIFAVYFLHSIILIKNIYIFQI